MNPTSRQFLDVLFDKDEEICVSHNGFAYHSIPQSKLLNPFTLISNNPKAKPSDISVEDINLVSVNPIKGPRNDKSVTAYRSFLVELDEGSLEEQLKYVEESGMPYSLCIFSGNKSLHFGIVLDDPYTHESIWRSVNQWILNIMKKADQQTKNPSRCIRFPGNKRHDGKQLQQVLLKNNGRIKKIDLNIWLSKHANEEPKKPRKKTSNNMVMEITQIPDWVRDHWDNGVQVERNKTWFNIACWYAERRDDMDRFIEQWEMVFEEEHDFKRYEWEAAIKSAFKKIQGI